MKELKDWSKTLTGIKELGTEETLSLYSEILATAHDIGYKVPDECLIETEDAAKLKAVIPPLHEGLIAFHAAAKADAKEKKAVADKKAAKKTAPKKPAKTVVQKGAKETTKMAKTAKVAAPAKKVAKGKAPAKKGAKKAAAANARKPAGDGAARNPFGEKAVIRVLTKENPARADSERGKRIAVVLKYNGKKVADYYAKEKAPFNRTDTLRYLIDNEHITVK